VHEFRFYLGGTGWRVLLPLRTRRHPASYRLRCTGLLGAESLPELELLKDHRPDALVITHAHSDHIGALAVVKLLFPDLPVYMTEATTSCRCFWTPPG